MTAEKLQTRAAVFILIKNAAGEILLQQRANSGYLDGYYDLACSGHVDVGESIQEAAIRELSEELGVVGRPQDLQLVHINSNYADTPYINFVFLLETWQGTPRICEPEKCTDLQYFAVDKLPAHCTLSVRVMEKTHFSVELTYSKTTDVDFDTLVGA